MLHRSKRILLRHRRSKFPAPREEPRGIVRVAFG